MSVAFLPFSKPQQRLTRLALAGRGISLGLCLSLCLGLGLDVGLDLGLSVSTAAAAEGILWQHGDYRAVKIADSAQASHVQIEQQGHVLYSSPPLKPDSITLLWQLAPDKAAKADQIKLETAKRQAAALSRQDVQPNAGSAAASVAHLVAASTSADLQTRSTSELDADPEPDSPDGPDAMIGGHILKGTASADCCSELIVVNSRWRIPVTHFQSPDAKIDILIDDGLPHFDISYGLPLYGSASEMAIVKVPLIWQNNWFQPDRQVLLTPEPDQQHVHEAFVTVRDELLKAGPYPARQPKRWHDNPIHPALSELGLGDYHIPQTQQIMLQLILSGHSNLALNMLYAAWPKTDAAQNQAWPAHWPKPWPKFAAANQPPVNASYRICWHDLSSAILGQDLWGRLGLSIVPDTRLLVDASEQAREP